MSPVPVGWAGHRAGSSLHVWGLQPATATWSESPHQKFLCIGLLLPVALVNISVHISKRQGLPFEIDPKYPLPRQAAETPEQPQTAPPSCRRPAPGFPSVMLLPRCRPVRLLVLWVRAHLKSPPASLFTLPFPEIQAALRIPVGGCAPSAG